MNVKVYVNPVAWELGPGRLRWPFILTTPSTWGKARRFVDAGGVEALLVDNGSYGLSRRSPRPPAGWLSWLAGRIAEIAGYAAGRGVARVLYVAPDWPGSPGLTARLLGEWLRGPARLLEGLAEPVAVVQPASPSARGLVDSLAAHWGLYSRFPLIAAPPVGRRRPPVAAGAWAALLSAAGEAGLRVHLLGVNQRLAAALARLLPRRGGCGALESGDTGAWYWSVIIRRASLEDYLAGIQRLLEAACSTPSPRRLDAWLA